MKPADIINNHPCPVCGHNIGIHVNSPFNHNPTVDNIPTGEIAPECPRTYSSLLIEKLTAWWNDAMSERDAYKKSYEEASKNESDYFNSFLNMTTVASNAAHDRDKNQEKLNIALLALSHIRFDYADNKPDPTNERHWFRHVAKNAQEEIEKIK